MLAIVKKLGFADLKSFSAALKANPKDASDLEGALLDAYKGYIAQMQPKLAGAVWHAAEGEAGGGGDAGVYGEGPGRGFLRPGQRQTGSGRGMWM